jgi:uncharacterized protein
MLGILIQLAISWLLLWFIERKHLSVLGFTPTKSRTIDFAFGFLAAALCCSIYCLSISAVSNNTWSLNPAFTTNDLLSASWWNLTSVLFEEFIFRGALLYILIQRIGITRACIVSAVAFGIYHWFSMNALGNPMAMIYLFFSTGIWGLMFAFAFAKTKSLYLPVALHLGWNLFFNTVFSQGPQGAQFLINSNKERAGNILSLVLFLFSVLGVPLIVYGYLKWRTTKAKEMEAIG